MYISISGSKRTSQCFRLSPPSFSHLGPLESSFSPLCSQPVSSMLANSLNIILSSSFFGTSAAAVFFDHFKNVSNLRSYSFN